MLNSTYKKEKKQKNGKVTSPLNKMHTFEYAY